ncbi:hypothetical protein SAMN05216436_1181, partial [bacterium A37T11]
GINGICRIFFEMPRHALFHHFLIDDLFLLVFDDGYEPAVTICFFTINGYFLAKAQVR